MDLKLASRLKRLIAFIFDLVLVTILSIFVFAIFSGYDIIKLFQYDTNSWIINAQSFVGIIRTLIFIMFILIVYYAFLPVFTKGQTLGMRLLNIKLVTVDGDVPTFGAYFIRSMVGCFLFAVTSFGLSTILSGCIILGSRRTTIHDELARTKVVEIERSEV